MAVDVLLGVYGPIGGVPRGVTLPPYIYIGLTIEKYGDWSETSVF